MPFSGIPRAPSQKDTRTRRALDRLVDKLTALSDLEVLVPPSVYLAYANTDIPGGNTFNNVSTGTFASQYTFPGNSLHIGDVVRFRVWGLYQHPGSPGTIQLSIKFNSTTVLSMQPTTIPGDIGFLYGWSLEGDLTLDHTGANLICGGLAKFRNTTTTYDLVSMTDPTAPVQPFDPSIDQLFTVNLTWASPGAFHIITLNQLILEVLPPRT